MHQCTPSKRLTVTEADGHFQSRFTFLASTDCGLDKLGRKVLNPARIGKKGINLLFVAPALELFRGSMVEGSFDWIEVAVKIFDCCIIVSHAALKVLFGKLVDGAWGEGFVLVHACFALSLGWFLLELGRAKLGALQILLTRRARRHRYVCYV